MKLIYQALLALVLGIFAAVLAVQVTPPPGKAFWALNDEPASSPMFEPNSTVEAVEPAQEALAGSPAVPTRPSTASEATGAVRRPIVRSDQSLGGPTPVAEVRPRPRVETPRPSRPKPALHRSSGQYGANRLHVVEVATVPTRLEATRLTGSLRQAGFNPYIVWTGTGFATRLGAFRERERAHSLSRAATLRGFQARVLAAN